MEIKKSKYKICTKKQKLEAVKLFKEGKSYQDIMKKYGVSISTAKLWVKKYGKGEDVLKSPNKELDYIFKLFRDLFSFSQELSETKHVLRLIEILSEMIIWVNKRYETQSK